jgi:transposase
MKIICGVDVSKARLDACIEPGAIFASFDNDPAGIAALAAFCRQHQAALVAMEATGGYERRAFLLLWEAAIPCAMTNPRSVRRYAEAMGVLEKTDRLDASTIARFAHAKNLQPTPAPTPAQQRLKALVARLRQVTDDLTVQKQRRSSLLDNAEMLASIDEVIALLKRQSRTLEGEIASMIDDDPLWAQLAEAWRSVKGVAGRTVARLMADLPEIGTYSNKAIAKLAGLAPLADDSGKRQGKRSIRGGRASVRSILFLVAAIAAKYDKSLAAFRERLLAAASRVSTTARPADPVKPVSQARRSSPGGRYSFIWRSAWGTTKPSSPRRASSARKAATRGAACAASGGSSKVWNWAWNRRAVISFMALI